MALKDNKAVVNIQGDSENDLEALFRVIRPSETAGMKKEPVLPMRMRKLPPSFFTPGSGDIEGRQEVKAAPQINPATGIAIAHSRAHSSPASLTVPKSSKKAVTNAMQGLHMRSQSYDASESNHDVVGPLPPGWEVALTPDGQKYFMNHVDQSTTWQDPRKTRSTSNLSSNQQLLPEGWQQAVTPGREVYFINHLNRTTSWADPRQSNMMNTGQNRTAGPPPPAPQTTHNNGIDRHQTQLHRLQMEKQMLQRRQEQLLRQEIVIKRGLLTKEDDSSSMLMNLSREAFMGIPNNEPQPQPALTSRHIREESADSGLGLGTFYPASDLDVVNGNFDEGLHDNFGSKENLQNNNNNLRPGQLPDCFDLMPSSNVDVGLMDGTDSVIGMDTDDLGVGLDQINSDLMLSDVEAALGPPNKIDSFLNNLNWV